SRCAGSKPASPRWRCARPSIKSVPPISNTIDSATCPTTNAPRVLNQSMAGFEPAMLWLSTRGALVVGQVALSIVLLIGATLLMEGLAHLHRGDAGLEPAHLL